MKSYIFAIGLLALLLNPIQADAQTKIDIFSPTGDAKRVSQVKVRFSGDMSTLGDLRQDDPFEIDCSTTGKGRWIDPKNWVYEFSPTLASGNRCTFTPLVGLKDISGKNVRFNRSYSFNTGGPAVRYTRPYDGSNWVVEDQYFQILLDGPADKTSVEKLGWCEVEGLATKIPVQVLDTPEGKNESKNSIWLRCQSELPAATKIRLVWQKGIASPSGIATKTSQSFNYKVRPPFKADFSCQRSSIKQPCSPLSDFRITFTSPISLQMARKIALHQAGQDIRLAKVDEDSERGDTRYVTFKGPFPENTDFEIHLPANLQDDADRKLKNAESFPLSFSTSTFPPLIKFSGDFGIIEHKTGGVLPVSIRGVEAQLSNRSISISQNGDFVKTRDPFEILSWMEKVRRVQWGQLQKLDGDWASVKGDPRPSVFKDSNQVKSFAMPETLGDKALEVIGIPLKEPGFYVVELSSQVLGNALNEDKTKYHVATSALVTNMAVHFLWGAESSAIWVTYLDSGLPVMGAQVQVGNECSKQILWSGTTGKDGIALVQSQIPDSSAWTSCYRNANPPLIITASKNKDFSFTRTKWNDGLSPWEFGIDSYYSDDTVITHTVLDRPLFRAGETVSMKHFVRETNASGFGLFKDIPANTHINITHSDTNQTYKIPVQFDKYGRGENSWQIPKDARLGSYDVSINHKDSFIGSSASFRIEEFKIPVMQAFLSGPTKPIIAKDKLQVSALVRYLSGGGASGQDVRVISELGRDWSSFGEWKDYSFDYQNIVEGTFKRGQQIGQKEVKFSSDEKLKLDKNGSTKITIFNLPKVQQRRVLRTELEYQDANGEFLSKTANYKMWPAALALGIKTEGWAASEDDLKFSVLAIDANQKTIAGQMINVKLYREKNLSWRKRMIGGYYAYENERQVSLLAETCSGKTDRNGRLFCKLKPAISGEVLLQAIAIDQNGNQTITTKSVWLVGEDSWWFDQQQADRMDLLVESVDLEDGDMAKIQVRSPFRSATALVAITREGVVDTFITNISGRNPVIEVPIKGEYAPNIYVSVLAVRGRVSEFRSWLSEMAREYDLPWLSRDGGRATGLIDLSKPAFRMGLVNIPVGHKAFRLNVDVSTDQKSYAIRETARVKVKITTANGEKLPANSEISLAVVDIGLLQLKSNKSWNVLDTFMKPRGLRVQTSTANLQVVGKRHYGRKAVAPGGGGADAVMAFASKMASSAQSTGAKPRELFDTILLWQGTVKLDKNGVANIEVPINDSLTAFEVVAIANAGVNKFGTGKAKFTVTQELQLISALPPVVRENDLFNATFTVRNTSGSSKTITVEASNTIGRALDPISLTIPAGQAREARWQILVPYDQAEIKWQIQAIENERKLPADNMIVSQKIVPAIPVTVLQSTIARLNKTQNWPVAQAIDALPGRGAVQIAMQSKLADGLDSTEDFMRAYPYTCFEQRTSVAIALNDTDRWSVLMAAAPAFLDDDGLLKYFVSDYLRGSDVLTAYVLKIADEAGWEIGDDLSQIMLDGLTSFVQGRLDRPMPIGGSDLTYRKLSAINALARYGKADGQMLSALQINPQLLPTSALLDWIGIIERADNIQNADDKVELGLAQLRVRLDLSGTRMKFSTESDDRLWWLMETIDANAARTLIKTQALDDWQDDVPRLSLGLLSRQKLGRWETTTANAWAMLAMRKFSDRFEKQAVTGQTNIAYGEQAKIVNWPKDDNPQDTNLSWQNGTQDLSVKHQGTGTPWVTITTKAAVPFKQSISAGYHIKRTITAVEQSDADRWQVGDVMKIRLDITANSDMTWVVIDDPVPAGATILGKGLQTSSARLSETERSGYAWPIFTERKFEVYRSYYRYVPKGDFSLEYTIRLNTVGKYQLPPSRVEAMYAPEIFGVVPIAELVIE